MNSFDKFSLQDVSWSSIYVLFLFLQSIFSDKDQIRNLFTTFTLSNSTFFWHVLLKIFSEHPDFWRGWRGYICRSIKAWKVLQNFQLNTSIIWTHTLLCILKLLIIVQIYCCFWPIGWIVKHWLWCFYRNSMALIL